MPLIELVWATSKTLWPRRRSGRMAPSQMPATLSAAVLMLSALGLLAACALLLMAGSAVASGANRETVFALFCWAWVGAGLLNLVVAGVQVFAPSLADGHAQSHRQLRRE